MNDHDQLKAAAAKLVAAVDALDGIEMPYSDAAELARACDDVRVLLGHPKKIRKTGPPPIVERPFDKIVWG